MIEKISFDKKHPIPKKLKALVVDSCKRHAWNIGVSHYKGTILYMEKDKEDDERASANTYAEAFVDRRYLRVTFKIYPIALKEWKKDGGKSLEQTIAHEVAHCATQHFYDVASARYCDHGEMKDAWEAATEVIANLSVQLDEYRRKIA